ncbi:TlpA disulfide reductase family protein [Hydrogenivirga sp.]
MAKLLPVITLFLLLISCGRSELYDLSLRGLDGREFSFSRFKGREFVVYVWSGTCIGHVEDLKELNRIYPELKVPVVSVAIMMDVDDVKEVLRKNGIEPGYPVLADPRGEFADMVTLVFLPATIVFNDKGEVVENYPKLPSSLIPPVSAHE